MKVMLDPGAAVMLNGTCQSRGDNDQNSSFAAVICRARLTMRNSPCLGATITSPGPGVNGSEALLTGDVYGALEAEGAVLEAEYGGKDPTLMVIVIPPPPRHWAWH